MYFKKKYSIHFNSHELEESIEITAHVLGKIKLVLLLF